MGRKIMFTSQKRAGTREEMMRKGNEKIQRMVDAEFNKQYQVIRQGGIDEGLEGKDLDEYLKNVRKNMQWMAIDAFREALAEKQQQQQQLELLGRRFVK